MLSCDRSQDVSDDCQKSEPGSPDVLNATQVPDAPRNIFGNFDPPYQSLELASASSRLNLGTMKFPAGLKVPGPGGHSVFQGGKAMTVLLYKAWPTYEGNKHKVPHWIGGCPALSTPSAGQALPSSSQDALARAYGSNGRCFTSDEDIPIMAHSNLAISRYTASQCAILALHVFHHQKHHSELAGSFDNNILFDKHPAVKVGFELKDDMPVVFCPDGKYRPIVYKGGKLWIPDALQEKANLLACTRTPDATRWGMVDPRWAIADIDVSRHVGLAEGCRYKAIFNIPEKAFTISASMLDLLDRVLHGEAVDNRPKLAGLRLLLRQGGAQAPIVERLNAARASQQSPAMSQRSPALNQQSTATSQQSPAMDPRSTRQNEQELVELSHQEFHCATAEPMTPHVSRPQSEVMTTALGPGVLRSMTTAELKALQQDVEREIKRRNDENSDNAKREEMIERIRNLEARVDEYSRQEKRRRSESVAMSSPSKRNK